MKTGAPKNIASADRVGIVETPDDIKAQASPRDAMDVVEDSKGRPIWCAATAFEIFQSHREWQNCLRYDSFQCLVMLYRPVPGTDEDVPFEPREVADTDFVHAQVWCNRNGFPEATRTTITDAFQAVARNNPVDPLKDWLLNLEWDGTSRLSAWLTRYLGVEESLYAREVGKCWMISAVARALVPGCKADGCLVLEGKQGGGKSSVLRILAGEKYFGDALPDLASKDASLYLRGKWIIELAELASLNKSSFEQAKAFISRQEERYRPPYGRSEITELRRCVIAGTTNRDDYLRDPTGNRRFWPVMTGDIDLDGVRRNREQLWAEAVDAFQKRDEWWLSDEVAGMAALEQSERGEDDPWIAAISNYCDGKEAVACKPILQEALMVPAERMAQRDSRRVAGILRSLGYSRDGQFTSGEAKGLARYVR